MESALMTVTAWRLVEKEEGVSKEERLCVSQSKLSLNSLDPLAREALLMAHDYITGGPNGSICPAPTVCTAALCWMSSSSVSSSSIPGIGSSRT